MSSEANGRTVHGGIRSIGKTNEKIVRMNAALVRLEQSWVADVAEVSDLRATRSKAIVTAETILRDQLRADIAKADELTDPSSLGFRLRKQLQTEIRMARYARVKKQAHGDPSVTTEVNPLPAGVFALTAEWNILVRTSKSEVEAFVLEHRSWEMKVFRRESGRPQPAASLWAMFDRLDQLHRALADGMVEHEVRQHVADVARNQDHAISEVMHQRGLERARLVDALAESVAAVTSEVGLAASSYDDPRWVSPAVATSLERSLRLGRVAPRVPDGVLVGVDIPALLPFPFEAGLAVGSDVRDRDTAVGLLRSILLRLLAAASPGTLHVKVVDPVALGQSVAEFRHLAEYDSTVADEKTWTSEHDVERLMADLSNHLEVVISRYLRGQFDTIEEYNEHAGEVAEPYRVLTVFDFPQGFTPRATKQLLSLIENGPRCGVYTVLHYDVNADRSDRYQEIGLDRILHSMRTVTFATPTSIPPIDPTPEEPLEENPGGPRPPTGARFRAVVEKISPDGIVVRLPTGARGTVYRADLLAVDYQVAHKLQPGHSLSVAVVGDRPGGDLQLKPVTSTASPESAASRAVPEARGGGRLGRVAVVPITTDGDVAPVEVELDPVPAMSFSANGDPLSSAAALLTSVGAVLREKAERPPTVTLSSLLPVLERSRSGVLPDYAPGAPPLARDSVTWWHASTARSAVAPIGRSGAQGVTSMHLSSTAVAGGAIMVGLPRSGKTTSLHSMILTLSMLYSPDELELYLIDAKHGVEFKAYEELPHARMVSVHSDREFSLAVLRSIEAEIRRRAELMKAHGAGIANITEYREATAAKLPRILVVVDEFHELFEEADAIGLDAFAAFSNIVRMGPFSGAHIIVASQTLSAMPAMDRPTLTLLPQRVAFMCNEYDAEIVLGESNKAARMLNKTGEGIYNPARGEESRNQTFQGLYVPTAERAQVLRELRAKADTAGYIRRPRVFDGDSAVVRPPLTPSGKPGRRLDVPVGEPLTLADSESLVISRSRGANVLVVGDRDVDDESFDLTARGVLHSVLLAADAQGVDTTVVDFLGDEELHGALTVEEVAEVTGARYVRSRGLMPVLAELAGEVLARAAAEDYRAPTRILVLFGIQRALSLTPYDQWSDDDPDDPSLTRALAGLLADGPEVGVHVVLDTDRVGAIERRLGKEVLDEVMIRVAGSSADSGDLAVVTGEYGAVAALRHGHLLLGNLTRGTTRRVRGYQLMPDPTATD